MRPRAFPIRTLVPGRTLASEAEDLGLYAASAARSWAHFPHMLRVDGLDTRQVALLSDRARLLQIPVIEAMPYRHGADWSEGIMLSADTSAVGALARDVGMHDEAIERALSDLLSALAARTRRLNLPTAEIALGGESGPLLIGIVNVTPDSFSDGGRFLDPSKAVAHGLRLAEQGARFLDVGGESSRPGSEPVSPQEELRRVMPVVEALRAALPAGVHLCIDTMKPEVAREAVGAGVEIINDVSGLSADPRMRAAAAELAVPVIVNHMRGTPRTMQDAPAYRHTVLEVLADLDALVEAAVAEGVARERILVDPGIGFGKRTSDNLALLRHLPAVASMGRPVVVGVSRKRFLEIFDGGADAASAERAEATLVAETCAALGGASLLRTHDPARAARASVLAAALAGPIAGSPDSRRD